MDGTPNGHSQNEYNRYCGEGTDRIECGLCDDGTIPDTLHNGACVKDDSNYDRTCVGVCEGSSSTTTQENYCV